MAKWNDKTKKYPRVEDRPDYQEPTNIEETLAELERGDNDCNLKRPLSPKYIHARLLEHYNRYSEPNITKEQKKIIINKAWNLSRPIVHQVIKKFRKTIDLFPHLRDEIFAECSIVVARTFREKKYDVNRSMMTSYFYEFFVFAILGCLSRYFKQKNKYVSVDPQLLAQRLTNVSSVQ